MMRIFLALILCLSSFLYAKHPPLEDMIAQMIVISFDGTKEGDKWVEQVAKDIKRGKVGGVILYDKNIQSPAQLKKLTDYFKAQDSQVLIIAEQEGGEHSIFGAKKGFKEFPSAYDMAKHKDIEESTALYRQMSEELAKSGINVNFAPVLDLSPKIEWNETAKNKRSYASFEEIVTTYARVFMQTLREVNIASVPKYFPTAGANLTDGFSTEIDVTKGWRFEQLKPYYDLIAYEKPDAVLMSHVVHKELDAKNPALFSELMIQKLLRDKMHFEGVVFADNLRSGSLSSHFDFKQRVLKSVGAGVDMMVFSNYFADSTSMPFTVQKILVDAVKSGEIKQEQIVLSYERIVKLKQKLSKKRVNHVN